MGWVGSWVHKFTSQWVGLGQLFGGLGWAGSMKIDPRTTLFQISTSQSAAEQNDTIDTKNTHTIEPAAGEIFGTQCGSAFWHYKSIAPLPICTTIDGPISVRDIGDRIVAVK